MTETLNDRLLQGFATHFGGTPDFVARAPGRVNLIGEHTDYNDGFALPVAIGAETRIALRRAEGETVEVAALDFGERDSFAPSLDLPHAEAGGWREYVRGTVLMLLRAGVPVGGAEVAIAGDVPQGTGLSSSASLEVAVATAFLALAGHEMEAREVALLAQRAENEFVGVRCGNLDQLAAAGTEEGTALLIDCRSLDLTPVPLPQDAAVMIVQSGVVRGLVEGEYNTRRAECEEAAAALGVAALRDANMPMLEATRDRLRPVVYRRARHVITDNQRTVEAAKVLRAGDLAAMGRLMVDSHASQRDDFGITVAETDRLAELMSQAIGPGGGARQTGGGFGGAVVGLMPADRVDAVWRAVLASYRTPDGREPDIRVDTAHGGAEIVSWR